MRALRSFVACAALAALTIGETVAAQNADCLTERELTSLVLYALPTVMGSAIKTCRPQLSPQGYFAAQGSSLVQRYAARKSSAWPDAKAGLLKIGGKDDKMKDMVANLSDAALQPFADGLVGQLVAKGIKPDQCKSIERAARLLSPLPPESMSELLTFVIVLAEKPKVRSAVGAPRKSEFNICPA
jgi:hypothetical protein